MTEELIIQGASNAEKFESLLPQLKALCHGEKNLVANLANIAGGLKEAFNCFWVGFYLVDSEEELVLGPFQGPIACTRIRKGKGVCGKSWADKKTVIVGNVEEFEGHIACSAQTKSEIVVPILKENKVIGVLDIDSTRLHSFSQADADYLETLCEWLSELF